MSIKIDHQINYVNKGEEEMSNTLTKKQKVSLEDLQEELEVRYGPALAQEIIDQIKKTEDQDNKPEFMAVKALSEALEIFRGEAQEIIKKLKIERSKGFGENIESLEIKRLQNELNTIFNFYWVIQHGFYKSFTQAMKICEIPATYRYDKYTQPTKMKIAA